MLTGQFAYYLNKVSLSVKQSVSVDDHTYKKRDKFN